MILPLLFVPVVYGLSSTPDACAAPPDPNFGSASASCSTRKSPLTGIEKKICCWYAPDGETIRCQSCKVNDPNDCDEVVVAPLTLPGGAVGGPPTGGVFEQPSTTPAPPPLFGENNNVPPTGGIEQPPTTTTPQTPPRLPGGGANVPTEGGSAEQPTTPQVDQDDNQRGGLPNIKNQENVPPGGGIAEQPEDDGQQEDSSEGAETAGPLT
jgi:hypothetical protein